MKIIVLIDFKRYLVNIFSFTFRGNFYLEFGSDKKKKKGEKNDVERLRV